MLGRLPSLFSPLHVAQARAWRWRMSSFIPFQQCQRKRGDKMPCHNPANSVKCARKPQRNTAALDAASVLAACLVCKDTRCAWGILSTYRDREGEREGRRACLPHNPGTCCDEAIPGLQACTKFTNPGLVRPHSLSLPLTQVEHSCTGKRNRLAFVPLAEFRDRELLSGGGAH